MDLNVSKLIHYLHLYGLHLIILYIHRYKSYYKFRKITFFNQKHLKIKQVCNNGMVALVLCTDGMVYAKGNDYFGPNHFRNDWTMINSLTQCKICLCIFNLVSINNININNIGWYFSVFVSSNRQWTCGANGNGQNVLAHRKKANVRIF